MYATLPPPAPRAADGALFIAEPSAATQARRVLRAYTVVLAVSLLLLTSCDYSDASSGTPTPRPSATTSEIVHVPLFVEDAERNAPSDPATLLYENRLHNPVLAPDGRHLTLAEFNRPSGTARVSCGDGGTRARLDLEGLVPNGVYTLWNVVFEAPGFDPTFAHMSGLGALGQADGTQNAFLAGVDGRAQVEAVTPAGDLSMLGSIGGCALTDSYEVHLVGALHLDGQTHGADLGPDGTAVEQFAFVFMAP